MSEDSEIDAAPVMPVAPVMIYGDDVTHVVTEEGVAYLYKASGEERRHGGAPILSCLSSGDWRASWTGGSFGQRSKTKVKGH